MDPNNTEHHLLLSNLYSSPGRHAEAEDLWREIKTFYEMARNQVTVLPDCHSAVKLVSDVCEREISVRDRKRFHCFKQGAFLF